MRQLSDADLSGIPGKRFARACVVYFVGKFDNAHTDFERIIENDFDLPRTSMYRTIDLAKMKESDAAKNALQDDR